MQTLNAFTVDVEDWVQSTLDLRHTITERVVQNTQRLLNILRNHRVAGTFFVLGVVAEKFPKLVAKIAEDGHEVGTHGWAHVPIFLQSPGDYAAELRKSLTRLESILGQKVIGHRAPYFSITADTFWAFQVMADQGILYDSSIFPLRGFRYGIAGTDRFPYQIASGNGQGLTIFPLSTFRLLGKNLPACGGGYFRIFPYSYTRLAIKQVQRLGQPAMFYTHPHELDHEEPNLYRSRTPLKKRLTQFVGRGGLESKLHRLFSEYRFAPAREVLKL